MKHQLKTLANGLRLLTVPLPVKSFTVAIFVDAGSRHETAQISGLSHFLEHMFFKGTKRRPTTKILATEVDSFGAEMNANTGKEQVSFYIKAAAEHLARSLDVLLDILAQSKLEPKEINKEKGVIIEEINMYEDIPMKKVGNIFESLLYGETSLGREIIGTRENIRKMKRSDFLRYLSRFYQPERMVVTIAGGVGHRVGQQAFLALPQLDGRGKVVAPKRFSFSQTQPAVKLHFKKTEQAHFCLGVRSLERTHPDRYVLSVLATILGGSMSSRLSEEVREKRGLAYYVRTTTGPFHETGYLVSQAGTDIKKINEAIKVILTEHQKAAQVSEKELKKAKQFLKGRLILALEDSYSVASLFGSSLLLEGQVRTPEEMIKGVEEVTTADIKRVAKKIFQPAGLNLAVVGPYQDPAVFEKLLTSF